MAALMSSQGTRIMSIGRPLALVSASRRPRGASMESLSSLLLLLTTSLPLIARLPWYKTPSPLWFIPGSLIMALTMGMTISPKVEIYYQLICRVMGPEESGTTLPPPLSDIGGLGPPISKPRIDNGSALEGDEVQRFVQQATTRKQATTRLQFELLSTAPGDTWIKQCHKSPNVQKAVSSLVRSSTLFPPVLLAL